MTQNLTIFELKIDIIINNKSSSQPHNSMISSEVKSVVNWIQVTGGQIYSQLLYTEENKHKPHLVSLHGGPGSAHYKMKWSIKELAQQFPIIFYDQLGGGESSKIQYKKNRNEKQLWTIDRFVDQLQKVVQFYKLQRFIILGTSWGATLALQYYFSGLTSPKPIGMHLNSPLVDTKIWAQDAQILLKGMSQEDYKTLKDQSLSHINPSFVAAARRFNQKHLYNSKFLTPQQIKVKEKAENSFNQDAYNYMWGTYEFVCTGTLKNYSRFNDLQKINIPTLFTCGQYDEARPQTVKKFHERVPNSKFFMIEKSTHTSYFQDHQTFKQLVLNFYNSVTSILPTN